MTSDTFDQNKLHVFQELTGVGTNLSLWQYTQDGHLVYSNSSLLVLDQYFDHSGCKAYMIEQGGNQHTPLVLSGPMGLLWSAVYRYQNGKPYEYYVLGPVCTAELSEKAIDTFAHQHAIFPDWREHFLNTLTALPVLSSILFFQYTLMLHYCVTGEKLERNMLRFQGPAADQGAFPLPRQDRRQTWLAERELLRMVYEGNLEYQQALRQVGMYSSGVQISTKDPVMQALISGITFTALCTREAIHAGISPDTAYSVGDQYIQSMVDSRNIAEIAGFDHAMYEDFIHRVHKHHSRPKVSAHIQACIEYIERHAEEPLTLAQLAERTGYSESHLSRKFHSEMGMTIHRCLQETRIEQSKQYLIHSDETISQIADRFQFSSSSHYARVFQEITGKKPLEYREENQQL